jgi:hypothetical protein
MNCKSHRPDPNGAPNEAPRASRTEAARQRLRKAVWTAAAKSKQAENGQEGELSTARPTKSMHLVHNQVTSKRQEITNGNL